MITEQTQEQPKFTAQTAHDLAFSTVKSQYDDIINQIKEAAEKGETELFLHNLRKIIVKELENNGFVTISSAGYLNVTILW